jgi:hypothetical protein
MDILAGWQNGRLIMDNKYFIAIYTHAVKAYCDETFFYRIYSLSGGIPVYIADNTQEDRYYHRLKALFAACGYSNFYLFRVNVPQDPIESQFQRNVCDSVNNLRDMYLRNTLFPYFMIIESDVLPPVDLLDRFSRTIEKLDGQDSSWGIVGGLYYHGFHNYSFDLKRSTLERTQHCLSGCTLYKRELIRQYPFRYDPSNLGPFPDAWICYDAKKEYSLWNDHLIRCEHLHNPVNGLRVV